MATTLKTKASAKADSPKSGRAAASKTAPNGEIIPEGHRWSEKAGRVVAVKRRTLPDGSPVPKGQRWDKELNRLVPVRRRSPSELVRWLEGKKVTIMEKAQADIDKIDARLDTARTRFRKRLTADEALKELETAGKTPEQALVEMAEQMKQLRLKMKAVKGALPGDEE